MKQERRPKSIIEKFGNTKKERKEHEKTFSSIFLALALCLGLAVPAFAADGDAYPTLKAPENSGIIFEAENWNLRIVGFSRSGSNNSHITYGTYLPVEGDDYFDGWDDVYTPLVPKMYRLSGEPTLISDVFTDVESGNWVSDPVAWALMNDITTGTSETEFSPSINCTQAQILGITDLIRRRWQSVI